MQEQAVLVLSSAVRSSPDDALQAILSSDSFAREVSSIGPVGSNALHVATWRNHLGIVKAILGTQYCEVDIVDEESGWTALHRAFYYGHIRISSMLMSAGASTEVVDMENRSPVDMVSKQLAQVANGCNQYEMHGHVFSWGNGSNYTLGTGSLEVELAPARVDALHMHDVVQVAAAKFHSAAVTDDGKLFTWGWGRGGRLGHPEFHIHSGNSAVIHPQLVSSLFSAKKQVARIAVAKHHTLVTTVDGELFSMGSNRYGQLGYNTGNTSCQTEPRKVSSLRACVIVRIAAANKHSVAVSLDGDVFTWGSNACGQLGYGSFDSNSSPNPRAVESLKGRHVIECAASKRHTLVLTADGDVMTWGHKGVSPRKVVLNGVINSHSLDGSMLRFQKGYKDVSKPTIVQICAGAAHSSALTASGVVLTWRSADPHCQVQEVGGLLAGKKIVNIAAGKYRTAAVSDFGTVYMWEGRADYNPAEDSLSGSGRKNKQVRGNSILGTSASHQIMGSSADSSASFEYLVGSSPSSFTHRSGSPSMLDRFHTRFSTAASPSRFPSPVQCHNIRSHYSSINPPFEKIVPSVVQGLRKIASVAVGEKHSVALQNWLRSKDDYFEVADDLSISELPVGPNMLQVQCQETIAKHMVDPYTVLQVMQYAEAAGAEMLYKRCCCVAALNLDIVVTENPHIFSEMPTNHAQDIENELGNILASIAPVKKNGHFVFLTPVSQDHLRIFRPSGAEKDLGDAITTDRASSDILECVPSVEADSEESTSEEMRKLRRLILKKMQQINALEEKASKGEKLDFQQSAKIGQKGVVLSALAALDGGVPHEEVNALIRAASLAVVESQQQRIGVQQESLSFKKVPTSTSKSKRKSKKEKVEAVEASCSSETTIRLSDAFSSTLTRSVQEKSSSPKQPAISAVSVVSADSTPVKQVGFNTTHSNPRASSASGELKASRTRKGGLSMFLKGELDDSTPKPAWGPSPKQEPPTSPLSKWFIEHKKPPLPINSKLSTKEPTVSCASKASKKQLGVKVSLKEYLLGKSDTPTQEPASSPVAWKSESPAAHIGPVKSLKTIQSEQEELRDAQRRITVPRSTLPYSKALTSEAGASRGGSFGVLGHSPGATCVLYGSSPQNRGKGFIASPQPSESRWYISEEVAMAAAKAKPLKDIQEEECALKHIAEIEAACQQLKDNGRRKENEEQSLKQKKKQRRRKKKTGDPVILDK